jgi:hypothetical protein
MALIASKYISKPFGDYTLKVCKKTKYIDGLHLFKTYNDTYEVQKTMKRMIAYIGRATFSKQVNADFDHIADKKLLNYTYLQKLCKNIDGPNFGPALISAETSIDELKELPKDIKFRYMIRRTESRYNKISQLDIHPMSAIGVAMWLSPSFGAEVKDVFLRFIEGDLTLIKEVVENANAITGKINNVITASNNEGKAIMIVNTYEKDSFDIKFEYEQLKEKMQELEDRHKGIIKIKDDKIDKLSLQIQELLGYTKTQNNVLNKKIDNQTTLINTRGILINNLGDKINNQTTLINNQTTLINNQGEKLDSIVQDRVLLSELSNPKHNVIVIKWQSRCVDDYPFCVFNCQKRSLAKLIKEQRSNMNCRFKRVNLYENCQPNAKAFWNTFIEKYSGNLIKFKNTSWFGLNDISPDEFIMKLNELENERIEL